MLYTPPIPEVPAEQTGTTTVTPRYDDICQDGRVALSAFPHAAGMLVWGQLLHRHPHLSKLRGQGILAILSRATLIGHDGVIAVGTPLMATGGFQLAHTRDERGEVERLILNLWVSLEAHAGRTHGPPPANEGAIVKIGTMAAEHVFTRPFAPREERKVRQLALPGIPRVPPDVHVWRPPAATLEPPEGATFLEDRLALDDAPVVFGLGQTDSNQHVNSLVYPRLFEEAALRRFARLGRDAAVLVRATDIAYRKPCFAGQKMRIALRAFELEGRLGAVGYFIDESQVDPAAGAAPEAAKPACYVQMLFSE